MFFQISFFNVVLVTHNIVYPCLSNSLDAVAIALHVLPEPVECHKIIPFVFAWGVKYSFINPCVGVYVSKLPPPFLVSHRFSIFALSHLYSEKFLLIYVRISS